MPYGSVLADVITSSDGVSSAGLYGFKNRLINGDMKIDQRNAGASVTPTTNFTYTLDRWVAGLIQSSKFSVQQNAGSVTPPAGFTNYLGITSLSAYSVTSTDYFNINQFIEGFNWADLGFGTANAATVTLSFWVRSSLTGTFGGALANSAGSRAYPFSYTISAANTWEQKTITIAGDTTGTWIGATNGIGARLWISLGTGSSFTATAGSWAAGNYIAPTGATSVVGTNGATFYITGVQLEKGSTATSFDYRPYGTELSLCQRYLPAWTAGSAVGNNAFTMGQALSGTSAAIVFQTPVPTRVPATGAVSSGTSILINSGGGGIAVTSFAFTSATTNAITASVGVASGLVAGNATVFLSTVSAVIIYGTGCEL